MSLICSSLVSTSSVYVGHAWCARFAPAAIAATGLALKTLGMTEGDRGQATAEYVFEV